MERAEAYSALADLIFKGFLTTELKVDNKLLIFKTVNEKEYDLIKVYSGRPDVLDYQMRFNVYFLIFSLFIADNQNILCDRSNKIPDLYKYFLSFPAQVLNKMVTDLNVLRTITYESVKYLEGFSYTNISRGNWVTLRGNLPSTTEFTGIPGTSELGMNVHQESWCAINKAMDDEDDYHKDFILFLMVSSASNPKGSRTIRNQYESAKKMAEDRKKKMAKDGFIDTKKWSPEGWAVSTDTAEELVAELEREISGVKDKHDIFMENYMKNLRDQAEKRVQEAEERINRIREGHDNVFIDGEQRAMTSEEVENLMSKKGNTTAIVPEDVVTPEDKNKFYKKIGARVLTGK